MAIWEIAITSYGIILSPIIGISMLIKRMNGAFKSIGGLLLYFVVLIAHIAVGVLTLIILPEGSWLKYPVALVLLFYFVAFGAPQYHQNLK